MVTIKRVALLSIGLVFVVIISLLNFKPTSNTISNILIDLNFKINFSDNKKFKEVNFDDSLWENGTFKTTSVVKEKGHTNKYIWVRKKIVIPASFNGKDIMLAAAGIENGYEIYLNGYLIAKSPIYPKQDFNIWNTAYGYLIPKNIIKYDSENVLAIRTYSTYEYGTPEKLMIGQLESIQRSVQYFNFWRVNLVFGFFILMVTLCIYFAIGYHYNRRRKQSLFAVLNFFAAIYFSNYIVYSLSIPYLLFQKIVFISLHMMAISVVFFVLEFLNLKVTRNVKIICSIMAIVSIGGIYKAKNLIELYSFRTYYMFCFFGIFIYFSFLIVKACRNRNKNIYKLLPPLIVLIFAGSYDTSTQYFKNAQPMGIQLSGFAIILFFLIVGFDMMKEYDLLYHKASVDGLTGIYNHVYFKNELNDLSTNERAISKGVSVVIYDIDDFKKINDAYGHSFGDTCLKMVANVITKNRTVDSIVARYGGEEFVMILVNVSKQASMELSDYIRTQISENKLFFNNEEIRITVSGGVSTRKNIEKTFSGKVFFDEADKAMYHSKENGKNRITHYSDINI